MLAALAGLVHQGQRANGDEYKAPPRGPKLLTARARMDPRKFCEKFLEVPC